MVAGRLWLVRVLTNFGKNLECVALMSPLDERAINSHAGMLVFSVWNLVLRFDLVISHHVILMQP